MCSQATTAGVMVTCSARTPTGAGGLPRLTVIVTRTACMWIVAVSTPRVTIILPTGLLSAISSTSPSARRYPLSYVFAGYYTWINAILGNQGDGSGYYSATASGNKASRMAVFPGSLIYSDNTLNKNYGYSLRRLRAKP